MSEEIKLTMSPLCQVIERNGKAVDVQIYKGSEEGWILEAIDPSGTSTVWEDTFDTDQAALDEVLGAINEEGIDCLIVELPH